MAFEGLVQWTQAAVDQSIRLSAASNALATPEAMRSERSRRLARHKFLTERHYFVVSAFKLIEFKEWAVSLGLCPAIDFSEIEGFPREHIKDLRDMGEHVIGYFKGDGHRPKSWVFETPELRSDASGTIGTLIGGRLDWATFSEAANRSLTRLLVEPIPYPSQPNMLTPPEPALSIRLLRGLAAMFGDDLVAAVVWWTSPDVELGGVPAEKMKTRKGYVEVVEFLEARAARQDQHKSS